MPPHEHTTSIAERLFEDYLARLDAGEVLPFTTFCTDHPEHASELRRLRADLDRLRVLIDREHKAGVRAPLADELRSRFGDGVDPGVSLDKPPDTDPSPSSELLRRLRVHYTSGLRYKLVGEVGRGGMGVVLKVWDEDLRRALAMKVVLGKEDSSNRGETPAIDSRMLGRFLEEAQITGQLDHPGIVPVHELGLASDGQVYFTMRLVKGEDLRHIFKHVETGHDGWNETRALGVLLKICEAMSYAHDKGVVHRDLKPANVMVGKYGEVYVMDWGLARVLGQKDRHDLRLRPEPMSSATVRTERQAERDQTPESPLVTMDGDVVGTPAYMPLEQARGDIERLGPRSDVYALGAMMYQLLTKRMPYLPDGQNVPAHKVLMRVLEGPPIPISDLAPKTHPELIAICERAMERKSSQRYRDMQALAEDLRAFLEGRVVSAYATGKWAETKKWTQRNKTLAATLVLALLILVSGLSRSTKFEADARLAEERREATTKEKSAQAKTFGRMLYQLRTRSLTQDLAAFEELDDTLDYARHQRTPAYKWWLEQAHRLVDGVKPDASNPAEWLPGLVDAKSLLARVRREGEPMNEQERLLWGFREGLTPWWDAQLDSLVHDLSRLESKIANAEHSINDPKSRLAWEAAIGAIAASDKYLGVKWPSGDHLTPQLGLVPIGPDPASGLWEFSHLASGHPPTRMSDGSQRVDAAMGLVFVLLPGGRVPSGQDASSDEWVAKLATVELAPFFVSKYEMTNEQWGRLGGAARTGAPLGKQRLPIIASWNECTSVLHRAGEWLSLPTEAQWEYSCRAGTRSTWWTGSEETSLRDAAHLSWNANAQDASQLSRIGSLSANPFGLHDVHGNAREWCRDGWWGLECRLRVGDGLSDAVDDGLAVYRGGACSNLPFDARSSSRACMAKGTHLVDIGVRPVRSVTP